MIYLSLLYYFSMNIFLRKFMKYFTFLVCSVLCSNVATAQFNDVYPIGDNPSISWRSGMTNKETVMFEAEPIVRYSFHNKIKERLDTVSLKSASAYYLSVRPQIRMYTDNSVPVKMPSYRVLLGYQYFKKLEGGNQFAFSIESGHYSNGQSGCTYDASFEDGSDACLLVYENNIHANANLSDLLNRKNGEFSTDLTELIVNYRVNGYNGMKTSQKIHSLKAGMTYYHDLFLGFLPFGGFSDNDIEIYGRFRSMLSYELTLPLKFSDQAKLGKYLNRVSFSQEIEWIHSAHNHVNPIRLETTASLFLRNNVGFFVRFIHGHDDYNIRFVDSGNEIAIGMQWSIFPLSEILKPSK